MLLLYFFLAALFIFLGLYFGDLINRFLGWLVSWLSVLLVLVTVYDVVLRYFFKSGSVATQELEWHLFALLFLLSAGYTFAEDQHVRVDVFYSRMSARGKALVNLIGTLFFLLPFCFLVVWTSLPFVQRSFELMESSADPGGLPYRYLIKAAIPLGVVFLALQGLYFLRCSFLQVLGRSEDYETLEGGQ